MRVAKKLKSDLKRAPVLFIGHGSPMNAIESNSFTEKLKQLRQIYPNPRAVLCVSAHWMTEGSWVTHMAKPKTIHDFYGFPDELFAVRYPAPGSPEIAELIASTVATPRLHLDEEMWGLDHGTWSVLRHIFPEANIPVIQLSLHMEQPAQYHFELGRSLRHLRDEGVLIVGSGNVVHNLQKIKWDADAKPFDWAVDFDRWIKAKLEKRAFGEIVGDYLKSEMGKLSVPTNEHFYPILYVLGAADEQDRLRFEFEGIQNASISMLTLSYGAAPF